VRDDFVLIIADRNRHVREFLRREFMAEGYRVRVARDGQELLNMINGDDPPHLVIVDLEIPFAGGGSLLESLQRSASHLPVVIHSFLTDQFNQLDGEHSAAVVEKCENTAYLKTAVEEMLRKYYPHRFASAGKAERLEGIETPRQ
jgi:DNA-binding response OmpR family regulator